MVSKGQQVIAIVVILVIMIAVGIVSTNLSNKFYHGGSDLAAAGTGSEIAIWAFRTEFGICVQYQVSSLNFQPLDVFLVTYNELQNYWLNGTFNYLSQGSAMNVTELNLKVTLDNSNEVYDLLIMSNISNTMVPYTLSFEQAPIPLNLSALLDALIIISWVGATALFFLLVAMMTKKK